MADDQTTTESNADYVKRTSMTVGELRQQYGKTFAEGYGDQDKIGEVLARAGVNTVEEYIAQHNAANVQQGAGK